MYQEVLIEKGHERAGAKDFSACPSDLIQSQHAYWKHLDDENYHSDLTHVNSTALKKIEKSPLSFFTEFYGEKKKQTPAMRLGSLLHKAVLEPKKFDEMFVVMPKFVGKTLQGVESANSKEAKEKRANWLQSLKPGAQVLTFEEKKQLEGMIESILRHSDAANILKLGVTERAGFYTDPETGIACRIKPDLYDSNYQILMDVKTTQDVSLRAFEKAIVNYGYALQLGMYSSGCLAIDDKPVEHAFFICIEKTAPYEVAVYEADQTLRKKGAELYRSALQKLKSCIQANSWPSYQTQIQPISFPVWALGELQ